MKNKSIIFITTNLNKFTRSLWDLLLCLRFVLICRLIVVSFFLTSKCHSLVGICHTSVRSPIYVVRREDDSSHAKFWTASLIVLSLQFSLAKCERVIKKYVLSELIHQFSVSISVTLAWEFTVDNDTSRIKRFYIILMGPSINKF